MATFGQTTRQPRHMTSFGNQGPPPSRQFGSAPAPARPAGHGTGTPTYTPAGQSAYYGPPSGAQPPPSDQWAPPAPSRAPLRHAPSPRRAQGAASFTPQRYSHVPQASHTPSYPPGPAGGTQQPVAPHQPTGGQSYRPGAPARASQPPPSRQSPMPMGQQPRASGYGRPPSGPGSAGRAPMHAPSPSRRSSIGPPPSRAQGSQFQHPQPYQATPPQGRQHSAAPMPAPHRPGTPQGHQRQQASYPHQQPAHAPPGRQHYQAQGPRAPPQQTQQPVEPERPPMRSDWAHPIVTGHADMVHDVQFDHFGRFVATASSDHTIRIFDIHGRETEECVASLAGHSAPVWKVSWAHPQFGRVLASCSSAGEVYVWSEIHPTQWQLVFQDTIPLCSVNDVAFGPSECGLVFAAATSNGQLVVYSSPSGGVNKFNKTVVDAKAHSGGVNTMCWAPPHTPESLADAPSPGTGEPRPQARIVTGGSDMSLRVWEMDTVGNWSEIKDAFDVASGSERFTQAHDGWVRSVSWAPAMGLPDDLIASSSDDLNVVIWRKQTGETQSGGGRSLVFERDATLRFLEERTEDDKKALEFAKPWTVSWSLMGNMVAVALEHGRVPLLKQRVDGSWIDVSNATEEKDGSSLTIYKFNEASGRWEILSGAGPSEDVATSCGLASEFDTGVSETPTGRAGVSGSNGHPSSSLEDTTPRSEQ